MAPTPRYLMLLIILLILCVLFFFLSGYVYVPKKRLVILSKGNRFERTLAPGWHYVLPLTKKVSASLPSEFMEINVRVSLKRTIRFEIRLMDAKAYCEGGFSYRDLIKDIAKESPQNPSLLAELTSILALNGIESKAGQIIER